MLTASVQLVSAPRKGNLIRLGAKRPQASDAQPPPKKAHADEEAPAQAPAPETPAAEATEAEPAAPPVVDANAALEEAEATL